MKTLVFCSSSIPATPEEREARRPIARDADAYQRMLHDYQQIAFWADEYGYDAFGGTEHHFQTEGGESIPNCLLLYAKLAVQTEKIMFVPISIVLPTHDPIRVAEDLALFGHMFPGRLGVSFARGYQSRWMQTLTQQEDVIATPMNPASDTRNRELFEEYMSVIDTAWEQDSFSYDGSYYQAPYPASGVPHWPLADWTRRYGSPGEVDDDGTVRKIGVIPKPLSRPPIFVPATLSEQTVIDAARHSRTVVITAGPEHVRRLAELYQREAREAGRDLRLGEGVGVMIRMSVGDSFDEAFDLASRTSSYWHHHYFGAFGFNEGYRTPDDPPQWPLQVADERELTRRMIDAGSLLCGTPEQLREQVADLRSVFGDGHLDWLVWEYWNQSLPGDDAAEINRRQLQMMSEQVLARLD